MKNKINTVFGLLAIGIFTFGILSIADANTYDFINTSGQRVSVTADTSGEALRTAFNLGLHSGVILVDNNTGNSNQPVAGQGVYLYEFINTSGQIGTVRANTPQEALNTAYQLGVHSGVIRVQ